MEPEQVEKVTDLVNAVSELAKVVGGGWLAVMVVGVVSVLAGWSLLRNRAKEKSINKIVEEKEKEIERLADDNRRYREVYLSKMGVPPEILKADREDSLAVGDERK